MRKVLKALALEGADFAGNAGKVRARIERREDGKLYVVHQTEAGPLTPDMALLALDEIQGAILDSGGTFKVTASIDQTNAAPEYNPNATLADERAANAANPMPPIDAEGDGEEIEEAISKDAPVIPHGAQLAQGEQLTAASEPTDAPVAPGRFAK